MKPDHSKRLEKEAIIRSQGLIPLRSAGKVTRFRPVAICSRDINYTGLSPQIVMRSTTRLCG
jgi:hypothetical protein